MQWQHVGTFGHESLSCSLVWCVLVGVFQSDVAEYSLGEGSVACGIFFVLSCICFVFNRFVIAQRIFGFSAAMCHSFELLRCVVHLSLHCSLAPGLRLTALIHSAFVICAVSYALDVL